MYKIQSVIDHIINVYDFELVSPRIPRDKFQYFKRFIYITIHNKSKKLSTWLMKVYPIKYVSEREDKSIWFQKRGPDGRISFEVEIKPYPLDLRSIRKRTISIYITDTKGIFKPQYSDNFKIKVYPELSEVEHKTFPINLITGNECIDAHFPDFPDLKKCLRDYKIKTVLND